MDWLQKILSNAVYGEDGKLDVTATMKKINEEAPKHIIPKEQYNGKVKELETANATIKNLEKNNKDNPELQNAIKEHEKAMNKLKEDHAAEIKGMRIDSAISKLLTENHAKFDGYRAVLHKGERVLTAEENKSYSSKMEIDYSKMEQCMRAAVRELTLEIGSREFGRIIDDRLRERRLI